jgi:NAD-dependent deacetylase sirtuin 2
MSKPKKMPVTAAEIEALRPPPVAGLSSFTLEGIASYIKSGRARRIVVACGAGMSCAAGIPDFRTPGTGLYDNLQQYNLPYPEAIFDIDYFPDHPEGFFHLASAMLPGKFRPTLAHYFLALLYRKGLALRIFTQNIDGLEREAGLPAEALVEAHGTYFTAHCLTCGRAFELSEIRAQLEAGEVVRCPDDAGIVKPDIVFFGEGLPERFHRCWGSDLPQCDLLIVIGTALAVMPFSGIIAQVGPDVPRLLINREKVAVGRGGFKFDHKTNTRDVFAGGDCQETVARFVRLLGWEGEFVELLPPALAAEAGFARPDAESSPEPEKE